MSTQTTTTEAASGAEGSERHAEAPIYEAFARFVGDADERASDFRMFATGYHAAAQAQAPGLSRKIDQNVWKAAQHLDGAQLAQPEWLWFADDGTGGMPAARYSFGRWAKIAGQAPYVRADIALGVTAPQPAGAERVDLLDVFGRLRDLADDVRYSRHEPFVLAATARALAEEVRTAHRSGHLVPASLPAVLGSGEGAAGATAAGHFACAARRQGTAGGNDPADCDWPGCGCDPYADKVIAALQESGALPGATPHPQSPSLSEVEETPTPDPVGEAKARLEELKLGDTPEAFATATFHRWMVQG